MCHPDEKISFFNDASFNVATSPADLRAYAKQLNIRVTPTSIAQGMHLEHLNGSGYINLSEPEASLLLDVAAIGPSYLPGHGHADSLSFVMSIYGTRVFVNSGVSEYKAGLIRDYERGTSAHNTVEVNGTNSSEIWAEFRVARRARPFGLRVEQSHKEISVSCAHDGYVQQFGNPIHSRHCSLSKVGC